MRFNTPQLKSAGWLLVLMLISATAFGQSRFDKDDKETYQDAEYFFGEERFLFALPLYDDLYKKHPEDSELKYKLGICYLHKTNERERAKELLTELGQSGASYPDLKFYIGQAHHFLYDFDQAIEYFQEYVDGIEDPENEQRLLAEHHIDYCKEAKTLVDDRLDVTLEIILPPSTDEGSEYTPLITPDEQIMLYTYRGQYSKGGLMDKSGNLDEERGEYYEDIMISYKEEDGTWRPGVSIGNSINTFGHDAATCISVDGHKLFVYKSDQHSTEDIYMSELAGEKWGFPKKITGDVNTEKYWEGSASLAADGVTLYFVSDRPGGFGGRDLYTAKLEDGQWVDITNMGPMINTKYDDDCPFIHADGNNLYFSSKGHNSMGGYDIFHTFWQDTGWAEPENIGYPVNTVDDDRYYTVSADGKRGYFSSAMASGGVQHDIYTVTPGAYERLPALVLIYGVVRLDKKPVEAQLTLEHAETGEQVGDFISNSETGKFSFTALPANKYKLTVLVEGQDPHVEYITVDSTDVFLKINHNFQFYSFAYTELHGDQEFLALQNSLDDAFRLFAAGEDLALLPMDEFDPHAGSAVDSAKLLNLGYPSDLDFVVQVGAYRFPGNFKHGFLAHLGEVRIKGFPDKITRFSMGNFKELQKAEELRQKIIAAGCTDAWILGMQGDQRILLDLEYDDQGVLNLNPNPKTKGVQPGTVKESETPKESTEEKKKKMEKAADPE